jgi:sugar lactone lactonase YvrE
VSPRARPPLAWIGLVVVSLAGVPVSLWRSWPAHGVAASSPWTARSVVVAGDGTAGIRDGAGSAARFSDPFGVAVGADGTIFVADAGDAQRIRAISPLGRVTTVAGGRLGFADGAGDAARFNTPSGIAIDAQGSLYVADTGNNAIRRITPDGHVSTIAGDGVPGYLDGPARRARFNGPVGVAVDALGRVLVADTYNDRIRIVDTDGTVRTIAGGPQPGVADGAGSDARFHTPCGVAVDDALTVYVADTGNGLLRAIDALGRVSTIGSTVGRPIGVAVGRRGERYVADEGGTVLEVGFDGSTRPLAGSRPGFSDGIGSAARFRRLSGIAFGGPGRLVVTDAGNVVVRLIAATSQLQARPPTSPRIVPRFDPDAFGFPPLLWPVAPLEGPHEIAGTIGEARGADGERFHAGVDVRVEEGTLVRAVRDGAIAAPIATADFGTLNEWLRIGAISYVHVRAGRTRAGEILDPAQFAGTYDEQGKLVGIRAKRGSRFATGDAIGTVNPFNHVHLNVGWPGEEHNPLAFRLVQFEDTLRPTIAAGGVRLYDRSGAPFTERLRGRILVSGLVQIVVDAWDESNGGRPGRRLGLYDLGYQVLNRDGSPAAGFETARHTIQFDRLTLDPEAARIVYAPGSGIPFYGTRRTRFLYIVTNNFRDGIASQDFWDTSRLPPGDYTLRIYAADIRGNEALANRDVPISVAPH